MRKMFQVVRMLLVLLPVGGLPVWGQSELPRVEVGVQFLSIDFEQPDEKPLGFGVRFTYNLTEYFAVEAEGNFFPENPSGNFGEKEGLFGLKTGKRWGEYGVFAKVRGGFVDFGSDFFRARHDRNLFGALDLGIVVEKYFSERIAGRMDLGDTMIFLGEEAFIDAFGQTVQPGVSHNTQISFGLFFRF